jgi:hypothetical protein
MTTEKDEAGRRVQIPVRLSAADADRLDRLLWHAGGRGRSKQSLLDPKQASQ